MQYQQLRKELYPSDEEEQASIGGHWPGQEHYGDSYDEEWDGCEECFGGDIGAVSAWSQCHFCKGFGHFARECPAEGKGKGGKDGGKKIGGGFGKNGFGKAGGKSNFGGGKGKGDFGGGK